MSTYPASGRVRPPAVAGVFYPAEPGALAGAVDGLLTGAGSPPADLPTVHGLVVPHAAYRYSGAVAAAAYVALRDARPPRRVVLVGPAHFAPAYGASVPSVDGWCTPLGTLRVDAAARRAARTLAGVRADDVPHAREHSLEVQLPFLQRLLQPPPTVLPVVVDDRADAVADVLDAVCDPVADRPTLLVVSTDLSHYLPDPEARARDERTAAAILTLDPEAVDDRDACGAAALRGLLVWAHRRGLALCRLALATSADSGGDPRRVVGYGAFAVTATGGRSPRRPAGGWVAQEGLTHRLGG